MAVMDEFKEERAAMKNKSFKEKAAHFWFYYKWHVIGSLALLFAVSSFIYEIVSQKETAFYAAMINVSPMTAGEEFLQGYLDFAQIDGAEYTARFDTSFYYNENFIEETSYTTMEKLNLYSTTAELDVMMTDMDFFQKYANSITFFDLRDILSAEQLAAYEPYFYYVDQKIIDEINANIAAGNLTAEVDYPDPFTPKAMETPIPVGIRLDSCEELLENYYFKNGIPVLGVYSNTQHLEDTVEFIDYIMQ